MSVGYDTVEVLGVTRGLIRFNLPSIPSSSSITSATLDLYHYYNFSSAENVQVRLITSDWTSSTATWNNTIGKISTTVEDTQSVNGSQWFNFNITDLVDDWYNHGIDNYGLALQLENEGNQRRLFYTSDYATDPTKHPKLTINYDVNPIGAEDFWTYTDNVHIANGNLMLNDLDVYVPGRGFPTTITRTYNSRSTETGTFGYGWSSELDISLNPVNKGPISLKDVDGTIHYFGESPNGDGTYTSPPGLYLTLTKNLDNYTVTDKSGIKYIFDLEGKLTSIQDLNGNSLTLEYTNGEVAKITDPSGRVTTISAITNNERLITDSANRTTKYIYNAAGDLIQVIKALGTADETTINYEYDSNHNLTSLTDGRGNKTYFYYWDDDRIKSINPINKVMNSNFEVDSDSNNIPDFWKYSAGQDEVGSYDSTEKQDGYGSFKLTAANTNSYYYSIYLSDPIPINPVKDYKLTGALKAEQTSGSLTTVLSLIAYDSNDQSLGEFARYDGTGTFTWQKVEQSIIANTTLPTETSYVKIKIAASNGTGNGTSWFDSIQLEEGTTASNFIGPVTYTVDRINKYSAVYDGNGKKIKYRYNDSGNLLETHLDPNGFDYLTNYTWDDKNNLLTMKDANANALGNGDSITNVYDNNGNLLNTQIDDGTVDEIKNTFDYNGNNDLIKAIDGNENYTNPIEPSASEEYYYDENRNFLGNNVREIDVTSSISYAVNGNITNESSPIGLTENLLLNSSFENDLNPQDNWPDKWTKAINGTATVTWGNTPYIGNNSITISNVSGIDSYVEIKSDTTYTFEEGQEAYTLSAYVNATTEEAAKNAYLKVDALDQNGDSIGEIKGLSIGEANEWNRLLLVIWKDELPTGTDTIRPTLVVTENTGTVNFDNVQLEKTTKMTAYNMVQNSSFENGATSPDYWSNTTTNHFTWTTEDKFIGDNSIKIANLSGWAGYIPDEYITYDPNKEYAVAGFVKGVNVSNPEEVYLKLKFYDSNKNEISSIQSNRLSEATTDWTLLIAKVQKGKAPIGTAYIKPVITAHEFTGIAYFDHIRVQEVVHNSYEYDEQGNYITKITDPKGHSVTYTYDNQGNVATSKDAKGNTTSITYDSFNQIKNVTIPEYDLKTKYIYDDNGNLKDIINTNNDETSTYNTTSYNYNNLNLLTSILDPLEKITTYDYDASGNLIKINYPNLNNINYIYNKANRLTEVAYNGLTEYTFSYDANGNRTGITDKNNNTWSYQLDRVERLDIVTAPDGSTQDNDYDKNSNRTKQTITVNTTPYTNNYYYSNSDKPTKLTDHNQNDSYFAFDEKDNLVQIILGNGSMSTQQFDERNQVAKVINTKNDGTIISSYDYTHDANGNIETVTDNTGKTISYNYDAINQLLSETDPLSTNTFNYQYDNLGNRTIKEVKDGETVISSTSYGYNKGNQLTSINGQTLIYDNNGNLTDDGTKLYTWDASGRLIEVRNKADESLIAEYHYDADDRRIKAKIYNSDGTIKEETNFHYDGESINVLYETDGSSNLTKLYTYSHDGILLSMTIIGQGTYYYHYNAHGDVVKLTAQDGTEVASYTYDAWGNILSGNGTMAEQNPYRYAGYRYKDTGMLWIYRKGGIGEEFQPMNLLNKGEIRLIVLIYCKRIS